MSEVDCSQLFDLMKFRRACRLRITGSVACLELTRFFGTLRLWSGVTMTKSRRYAPEYGRQMAELVRTGRMPEELSREFECSAQAIRN